MTENSSDPVDWRGSMQMAANRRFNILYQFMAKTSSGDTIAEYREYLKALEADIEDIWRAAFNYVGCGDIAEDKSIEIVVNREGLTPKASVQKRASRHVIELSATLVMMVDQLTCFWARQAFEEFETFGLTANITERSEFAFDFSYLFTSQTKAFADDRPVSSLTQIIAFSTDPKFNGNVALFANLTICWIILHEFFHIHLGHLNDDRSKIDEAGGELSSEDLIRELEADSFATISIITFANRLDFYEAFGVSLSEKARSNWFQYLQYSILQSCCIMHRLSQSIFENQSSPLALERINNLRLHNIFRSSISTLHDIDVIHQAMEHQRGCSLRVETSDSEIIEQVSKNMNNIDWLCRSLNIMPLFGTASLDVKLVADSKIPFQVVASDQVGAEYLDAIIESLLIFVGKQRTQSTKRKSRAIHLSADWDALMVLFGAALLKRIAWSVPESMGFLDAVTYVFSSFHTTVSAELQERAAGLGGGDKPGLEEGVRRILLDVPEFEAMTWDKDRDPVRTADGHEISIEGVYPVSSFIN